MIAGWSLSPATANFSLRHCALCAPIPTALPPCDRRARAMLDSHFTRRHAFACWQILVEEMAGSAPCVLQDSRVAVPQDKGIS
jgi:hypothetical protein